ncbi:hypothetical protein PG987_013520 [Apiospora arundinis]
MLRVRGVPGLLLVAPEEAVEAREPVQGRVDEVRRQGAALLEGEGKRCCCFFFSSIITIESRSRLHGIVELETRFVRRRDLPLQVAQQQRRRGAVVHAAQTLSDGHFITTDTSRMGQQQPRREMRVEMLLDLVREDLAEMALVVLALGRGRVDVLQDQRKRFLLPVLIIPVGRGSWAWTRQMCPYPAHRDCTVWHETSSRPFFAKRDAAISSSDDDLDWDGGMTDRVRVRVGDRFRQ